MPRTRHPIDISAHLIETAPVPRPFPLPLPDGAADRSPAPVNFVELFGNDHPVELEVGSGKGLFLANAARANPGRNYLGVEIARKYARLAAERLARQDLGNAKVWAADIRGVLGRIPDRCLRAVHVYFPDPWWKKRHKKRRVFTGELVTQIERVLQPGGELLVASDVEEYFSLIRDLIAASPAFRERSAPELKEPEHELDYLTNFERKYRLEGRPVYRAAYDHVPGEDAGPTFPSAGPSASGSNA
jgi:tRNA (guanine-N7-)-methyltransferase